MESEKFKKILQKALHEVLLENRCWKGYEPVKGKEPYSKGSCRKKQELEEIDTIERHNMEADILPFRSQIEYIARNGAKKSLNVDLSRHISQVLDDKLFAGNLSKYIDQRELSPNQAGDVVIDAALIAKKGGSSKDYMKVMKITEGKCNCGPDCECGGNCGSNCKCKGCSGNLDEITDKDMKVSGFRKAKKIERLRNILKDDLLGFVGSEKETYDTMHYITKIRRGFAASGQDELILGLLKQIVDEEPKVASLMKRVFGDHLSEGGGTCTKPSTQKTSSDRKDKKWTKCSNGKRIHWGDPNAKVTGKSGNTKRKKNFRARHNCSSAKPGTPRHAACQDW